MTTIYDWLTVSAFIALAILYLQRSSMPEPPDKIWHYIPPAVAFGVANYLGNNGYAVASVLVLMASLVYSYYVIYRNKGQA